MPRSNPERLKSYLKLITGKEGLERVREVAPPPPLPGVAMELATPSAHTAAQAGLESLLTGKEPSPVEMAGLEALIIPELRPAVDIVDGKFQVTHRLWTHLSTDAAIRARIEDVIPSVGRLELPGNDRYPYGGTGFVVGNGLLMTNRHVAAIFADGLGSRNVTFKPGYQAGIDFLHERGGPEGKTLLVRRVVMIHPYWDMAILAVENLTSDRKPLKLSLADVSDLDGREIVIIGYPAFDPRNDAVEQDKLFAREYGVKRMQPGKLHARAQTESFGKMVSATTHDCSTLGGNSGSMVMDLTSGEIVALHFGGRYHETNYAVPAFELARDGRVVDSGVTFAGTPAGGTPPWAEWWNNADLAEAANAAPAGPAAQSPSSVAATPANVAVHASTGNGVTFEIPLRVTVSLGAAAVVTAAAKVAAGESVAGGDIVEALVEPEHDTHYETRTGYDDNFLDVKIPMPKPADPSVLAPTRKGGTALHYQNFSVMMHAARRLALVAASNVTAEMKLRRPDPTKQYTRKALTGLGDNDQERWFIDPRLDEKFQLPDVFFTKDRKAFDKGHIVRRDDVCWGKTYDLVRRANGDTYHVTNCSPQTAEFNQSARGVENWGDLENKVLASAAKERFVLFAAPVLDPADTVFVGAGGGKLKIRARIPSRFWKVVVASVADGLAAYGFVLEQDLSGVEFEFVVSDEFVAHMYPLSDIEKMAGIVFPDVVRNADQFDTVRGAEVSIRAGTRRKRRS